MVIGKEQIQAAVTYHLTPARMVEVQKVTIHVLAVVQSNSPQTLLITRRTIGNGPQTLLITCRTIGPKEEICDRGLGDALLNSSQRGL